MTILVAGGAGYIGGVCVEKLLEEGYKVVIVDSLVTGHKENINPGATFYKGSIGDKDFFKKVLEKEKPEAVFHFAGLIQVGESVKEPDKYFENNLVEAKYMLDVMMEVGIKKVVFSSTAAVYGTPERVPIKEEDSKIPINPYGEAKRSFELILERYHEAYGLKYHIFRYFNAAGATEKNKENHVPETHLIPLIMQAAMGKRQAIYIFGTDYDTPDGTCIRDYVHVADIVQAHLLAIKNMEKKATGIYNLGNGGGYSVREVIETVKKVSKKDFKVIESERRPGDPARLVASSEKVQKELGWKPEFPELEKIIETAWKAETKNG